MPDLDVEALARPVRRTNCSILYVCRQLYNEAIPLFYGHNVFHFWKPWHLAQFSDATFAMGNLQFITSLSIVVDLWDRSEFPDLWKHWQDFFEGEADGRGLSWHFPGLKNLVIELEPSSRFKEPCATTYVDGQPCRLYRRRLNQRPYRRQSGFDSFADTLRRTVRAKKVGIWNMHDTGHQCALEQEMMGLGSWEWPPKNVYDPALPCEPLHWGWWVEAEAEIEAEEAEAAANEAATNGAAGGAAGGAGW